MEYVAIFVIIAIVIVVIMYIKSTFNTVIEGHGHGRCCGGHAGYGGSYYPYSYPYPYPPPLMYNQPMYAIPPPNYFPYY